MHESTGRISMPVDQPAYPHFNLLPRYNLTQIFYTLQVQLDGIPCAGRCDPVPYISLAADVCKINSTVFPNLGSMVHSKESGWLRGMQKQNCEKKQASRCTSILRDKTRGEFGMTYCSFAGDLKTSCD